MVASGASVRFSAKDGVTIEGRLILGDVGRAAVLCHPHPQYGGSMDNPVIRTAEDVFRRRGWTTLAFNFRGVGGSGGSYGQARGERLDVEGAIAYLERTLGAPPRVLAIAGYSFGAFVGGRVAADRPDVGLMVCIAPPLAMYPFEFLKGLTARKLLLAGTRDEFCAREALEAFFAALPEPKVLRLLETDHYFTDREAELRTALDDVLAGAGGP